MQSATERAREFMTLHPSGQYVKKCRGRQFWFGRDPEKAVELFLARWPRILKGEYEPETRVECNCAVTVQELGDAYLQERQKDVDSGELHPATWEQYRACLKQLVSLTDDKGRPIIERDRPILSIPASRWADARRAMIARYAPKTVAHIVATVRTLSLWAYSDGDEDERRIPEPLHLGKNWRGPDRKDYAAHKLNRQRRGDVPTFTPDEVRAMLTVATPRERAALLTAVNCGYGNNDIGTLEVPQVDLKNAVISTLRQKTGAWRVNALWPETVEALRKVIGDRKEGPVFRSRGGKPLVRYNAANKRTSPGRDEANAVQLVNLIVYLMKSVLKRAGIEAHGRSFYSLRHTYRTLADTWPGPRELIDLTMGRTPGHISEAYKHRTYTRADVAPIADHVRAQVRPDLPTETKMRVVKAG